MADIHDRAYNRAKSRSKALRKYHIDRDKAAGRWSPMYDNLHSYSVNPIHCSCPLCSAKTKNKGKRRRGAGGYEPTYNPTIADRKKVDSMDAQEKEDWFEMNQYFIENFCSLCGNTDCDHSDEARENHCLGWSLYCDNEDSRRH